MTHGASDIDPKRQNRALIPAAVYSRILSDKEASDSTRCKTVERGGATATLPNSSRESSGGHAVQCPSRACRERRPALIFSALTRCCKMSFSSLGPSP